MLEQLYAPFAGLIAPKLHLLYLNGGQPERARSYNRRLSIEPSIAAQLAHVQFLVDYTPDDDWRGAYLLLNHGLSLCNRLQRHPHLWPEALPIAQELHRRAVLLADRGRQADACYFQASFYYQANQLHPALDWASQAVALYESLSLDVGLGRGLSMLGTVLHSMGDRAGARPYYERALAIKEKALGPEHPDTASSLHELAILCYHEGQLAEAARLMRRALSSFEAALGPDHPNTQTARQSLATIEKQL